MRENQITDLIFCTILGWTGAHKFYERKTAVGVLYLFTFGLFGIGWITDTIQKFREIKREFFDYDELIEQYGELCNRYEKLLNAYNHSKENEKIFNENLEKVAQEADLKAKEIKKRYSKWENEIIKNYSERENEIKKFYFERESKIKKDYFKQENEYISKINNLIKDLDKNEKELVLVKEKIENYEEIEEEIARRENLIEELNKSYEDIKNAKEHSIKRKLEDFYKQSLKELEKNYQDTRDKYEEETERLKKEIKDLKKELELINSDCIPLYYKFSEYDNISSDECKDKMMLLKQEERFMRKAGTDIIFKSNYNKSKSEGQKDIRKILRNFNAECDNIMLNISYHNIDRKIKNIQKSFDTINQLYEKDGISLTLGFLELKFKQISLIREQEFKSQQEKEFRHEIQEQMLEEAKAQKEIEERKKKIEKDLQQHLGEMKRMMKYMQTSQIDAEKQLYIDKIKELEEKIKILESDKETVLEREGNAKAGFVYIISNIGSFGENIYKIGMTRRLEPMDRIKELSSASVPFEFDVHAMIFSSDAPELETTLHKHFADYAVNKVNPRKEFYNVNIDEIEKVVKENYNDTVRFIKIPKAEEYRQSLHLIEKE